MITRIVQRAVRWLQLMFGRATDSIVKSPVSGLLSPGDTGISPGRAGRVFLVLIGTPGARLGALLLALLHRSGMAHLVGGVYLVELHREEREAFLARVGAVYGDRIEVAESRQRTGGFQNADFPEIWRWSHEWLRLVLTGAQQAVAGFLSRNHGIAPDFVLAITSPSSTGYAGIAALQAICAKFPRSFCVVQMHLPRGFFRERVPYLLEGYRRAGARGFLVSDEAPDEVVPQRSRSFIDDAVAHSVTGLHGQEIYDDFGVAPNNAFRNVLRPADGSNACSLKYVADSIPAQQNPDYKEGRDQSRWQVDRELAVTRIEALLVEVRDDSNAALTAPFGAPGSHPTVIVIAPIVPHDFRAIKAEVLETFAYMPLEMRPPDFVIAPIAAEIDPDDPQAEIAVCYLDAVDVAIEDLVDTKDLPPMPPYPLRRVSTAPHVAAAPRTATSNGNGHAAAVDIEARREALLNFVLAHRKSSPTQVMEKLDYRSTSPFYDDRDALGIRWDRANHTWECPS